MKRRLAFLAGAGLLACGGVLAQGARHSAGAAFPAGTYCAFLTSEGAAGPALIARLDAKRGSGWLYIPPWTVALRIRVGRSGFVRITAAKPGLAFSGRSDGRRVRGEVRIGPAASAEGYFGLGPQAIGRRIPVVWRRFSTSKCPVKRGWYSDRRFSAQAQEWTGSDLLLTGCGPGYSGALTVYEGVPVGPAVIRARAAGSGRTVTFTAPWMVRMLATGAVFGAQHFFIRAGKRGVRTELPASLGGKTGAGEFLRYEGAMRTNGRSG
jgi:hypothetical protein